MFRHSGTSSSQNLFLMTHGCTELNRVAVIISVSAYLRYDVVKNVTWRHIDVTDRQTDISSPDGIGTRKQASRRTSHILIRYPQHLHAPIHIMLLYCCTSITGSSRDCSVLWPRLCSDRFRVLTAETINVTVFWDVTPCNFFCCSFWSIPSFFVIKPTRCTNFTNLFWHETLHVSDISLVHHQEFIHCALSNGLCHTAFEQDQDGTAVPSWSCSKAVYKPVWHIPLLSVQWIISWWWSDELSETCRVSWQNQFVKLVHLVGFIIKKFVAMHGHMSRCTVTWHDARSNVTLHGHMKVIFLPYSYLPQVCKCMFMESVSRLEPSVRQWQ